MNKANSHSSYAHSNLIGSKTSCDASGTVTANVSGKISCGIKPVLESEVESIGDSKSYRFLSFKIQSDISDQLAQLAKLKGLGCRSLLREILTNYVRQNEHMLK